MKRVALYVIGVYQRDVADTLGSACPFDPTCSEYATLAFERHGTLRAIRLIIGRLRRCRPG